MKKTLFLLSLLMLFPAGLQAEDSSEHLLNEKQKLLDNAIEEIVYLKEEKESLKKQVRFLSQKYTLAMEALNLIREGRHFEAAEALSKINRIDPKDKASLDATAVLYSELKIYDKAIDAFKKQIQIDPQNEKIYTNLGFLFAQQSNHSQAIDYYLKSLSLNPDFPVTHYNLALTYIQLGEREKAVQHFKTAASLFEEGSQWKDLAQKKALRYSALKAE